MIKNIKIPLIVISWCAINAYEDPTKDNVIKNSLFFKYFGLCIIFFILTIMRIIDDKWINLYRKNILENSKGKRKCSNLILPIVSGNKIYWSKKDISEMLLRNSVTKKTEIMVIDPKNP